MNRKANKPFIRWCILGAVGCGFMAAGDWLLGLLSLAPVVLAFLIMATMTGKRMAEKMRQYGNALEAMVFALCGM